MYVEVKSSVITEVLIGWTFLPRKKKRSYFNHPPYGNNVKMKWSISKKKIKIFKSNWIKKFDCYSNQIGPRSLIMHQHRKMTQLVVKSKAYFKQIWNTNGSNQWWLCRCSQSILEIKRTDTCKTKYMCYGEKKNLRKQFVSAQSPGSIFQLAQLCLVSAAGWQASWAPAASSSSLFVLSHRGLRVLPGRAFSNSCSLPGSQTSALRTWLLFGAQLNSMSSNDAPLCFRLTSSGWGLHPQLPPRNC